MLFRSITTLFDLKSKIFLPNVTRVLNAIKNSVNEKCGPMPSMPKIYKFKQNIVLDKVIKLLLKQKYEILSQILNYNGKIIGITARKGSRIGYVPVYPSSPSNLDGMEDLVYKYMDDDDIWTNYADTIQFLNMVHNDTGGKIPCSPKIKVIDDGMVVGLLTDANQFVALNNPANNDNSDDLDVVDNASYLLPDQNIDNSNIDKERIEYITNIQLETKFYYAFRNLIRLLLGKHIHIQLRKKIEILINKPTALYLEKLKKMDTYLRKLTKNDVMFAVYDKKVIKNIQSITNCLNIDDCDDKQFCMLTDDAQCKLIIPKNNLINNQDNELMYYTKIADEFIRYNRIKQFIFQPKSYLTFSNTKYKLNDDEILILQSFITQEYFENLSSVNTNTYIKNNAYDLAKPSNKIAYTNDTEFKEHYSSDLDESSIEQDKDAIDHTSKNILRDDVVCNISSNLPKNITGIWESSFPSGSKELFYDMEFELCTYEIILNVIKDHNVKHMNMTKKDLKNELLNIYKKYHDRLDKVLSILATQHPMKNVLIKKVFSGDITFEDLLLSESYFLTNLDIWVIAKHYNIPLILYAATRLQENDLDLLVANSTNVSYYYFIKSPGLRPSNKEQLPSHRLVVNDQIGRAHV